MQSRRGVPDFPFVLTLTWLVAPLLVLCSLAGLLYGQRGLYDRDALTLPAQIGQDAVMLIVGVPLLIASALLARRGSTRALLSWVGALFFIAYFNYFYVVGIRFNLLFPAYIAVMSMSMYGALALLFGMDFEELKSRFTQRMPIRLTGAFLMITSSVFATLWMTFVLSRLLTGTELEPIARTVIAIDSVVLLPLAFFAGLWLWRREARGYVLASVLLIMFAATFLTLVVSTIIASQWGYVVEALQTVLYGIGLVVSLALLVRNFNAVVPGSTEGDRALIERFMPKSYVAESHEVLIRAPADTVFDAAANVDLESIPIVHVIFWAREKLFHVESSGSRFRKGLVAETIALGWGVLAYRPGRELVMGAVTQPWVGNVKFRAIPSEEFARFSEPDLVKIVWTLECKPVDAGTTRFRTQTRVMPTDDAARRKFRRYWLVFGIGIVLIRHLANRAIRREAERRAAAFRATRLSA
jgi:hypothetical protein